MSLRKIVIYAFEDKTHATKQIGKFELPINPESYKRSHQIALEDAQGTGNQSNDPRHAKTPGEELSLEFTLDNTKTVEGNTLDGTEVSTQVNDFLKLTYKMNGEIRKPNFLKIIWANDFVFDCQLTKADVNYTLFKPDGSPLRAKISATFKEHKAPEIRVKEEDKASNAQASLPDLSKAGNSLSNAVQQAFKSTGQDSSILMQVAKANDLVNFRKAIGDAANLVLPAVTSATDAFQSGVQQARSAANEARNAAQNAANTAQSAATAAQGAIQSAQSVVQNAQSGIQNAIAGAQNTVKAAQNAVSAAQNAANSAKNAAEKAKDAAKSAKNAAQNTANTARNAANKLKSLF